MKSSVLTIATAMSLALSSTMAYAADNTAMEKCVPMGKDGKNLVKEHKGDCKAGKHSCAGQSTPADSDTWIYVPTGICDKIKAEKWADVPQGICDKLDDCKK